MTQPNQPYTPPSADDFLMGGGIPSVSFKNKPYGTTYRGIVDRHPEVQQQTDFDSGKPLFWDDGKPKWQAKIVIRTDERDPKINDDDGLRAIYAKGEVQKAIAAAVRSAGAKRVEPGGELSLTFTGEGEAKNAKLNPPKQYSATYVPPNPLAMAAEPDTTNVTVPGTQQATPQPAAAPAAAADDPAPAGVDPAQWALLDATQRGVLRAALAASQPAY